MTKLAYGEDMDCSFDSHDGRREKLTFLQGHHPDDIARVKNVVSGDQIATNKIRRIREILRNDDGFVEWVHEITAEEQMNKLTGCGWNLEKFHEFMHLISKMSKKDADEFFTFCRNHVVDTDWPGQYAMTRAKDFLLNGSENEEPAVQNDMTLLNISGDCYPETVHAPTSSVPEALTAATVDFEAQPDFHPQETAIMVASFPVETSHVGYKKSLNVVFIGTSGCGKTTMVNGISNCFKRATFEKAIEKGPTVCVQTCFTTFLGERTTTPVEIFANVTNGTPAVSTENRKGGASKTQDPLTHEFAYKREGGERIMVNITDTPGMNDTEGEKYDEANLDKIFEHLETLEQIDAICMVLKPNEARLTLPFRTALNKLLKRIPRDCYKNIIFCFTHCQKPDQSLILLRNDFKDRAINTERENVFCFDNEPFRYLCTLKSHPSEQNARWTKHCKELYEHNVAELRRMLFRIERLTSFKLSAAQLMPTQHEVMCTQQRLPINKTGRTTDSVAASSLFGNSNAAVTDQREVQKSTKMDEDSYKWNGDTQMVSYKGNGNDSSVARPEHSRSKYEKVDPALDALDFIDQPNEDFNRICRVVEALIVPLGVQIVDNLRAKYLLEATKKAKRQPYEYCTDCKRHCKGSYSDRMCDCCTHHWGIHKPCNFNDNSSCLEELEREEEELAIYLSEGERIEREQKLLDEACLQFSMFSDSTDDFDFSKKFKEYLTTLRHQLSDERDKLSDEEFTTLSRGLDSYIRDFTFTIIGSQKEFTREPINQQRTVETIEGLKKLTGVGQRVIEIVKLYSSECSERM